MTETAASDTDVSNVDDESTDDVTENGRAQSAGETSESDGGTGRARRGEELLVQEGDVAGDYLEQLLDLVDYDGDIDLDVEGDRAIVSIEGGSDLDRLVGSRGAVLEALQELTRLAVQQATGTRSRLMLDVARWRAARREELSELGRTAAEQALDGGESVRLQVMTPFERKVVHDAVAEVDGVSSESEGEEPRRRVVVIPD